MKHFYSWLSCIFVLATVILFGCNKEYDITPNSSEFAVRESIKEIKHEFLNRSHNLALHDKLGNNSEIYWEPAWQHAFEQSDNHSVKYIYIPLTSKLKSGQDTTTFNIIDTYKFIIGTQSGAEINFMLATYRVDNAVMGQKDKSDIADAFHLFTGTLLLKDLTNGRLGRARYRNGIREDVLLLDKTTLSTMGTEGWDCKDVYTCYWTYPCSSSSSAGVVGGSNKSVDGYCQEPTYEPAGCNWGMNWSYSGSVYEGQECNYVEDPPLPGGGGSGGSGGGTSGTHIDNLIYYSTLSADQYDALTNAFEEMIKKCIGIALYNGLVNNSMDFTFKMNSGISAPGTYDPNTNTINFKSASSLNPNVLLEELFHGYQDYYYGGTGSSFYSVNSRANIEFEIGLLRDIYEYIEVMNGTSSGGSGYMFPDQEYFNWLTHITNQGTAFPRTFADIEDQYGRWLSVYAAETGWQKSTLYPSAMFKLIQDSDCPTFTF